MPSKSPTIVVTGAAGFIGRNLLVRLQELGHEVRSLTRDSTPDEVEAALAAADVVFHLASAIRPPDPAEFDRTVAFARAVARTIAAGGRRPLVIFSSSRRADAHTDFAACVRVCEKILFDLGADGLATVAVYRLPNVFGKWARPNYNSCVATFCHNLARGLAIRIDDPAAPLPLLYVDDLVTQWVKLISEPPSESGFQTVTKIYDTSVGDLATMLRAFAEGRRSGQVENVGSGLRRALYATFIAALPTEAFSYPLAPHIDARGSFAEVLKTRDGGQVSVLTAGPGVTRGGHYHHTKVERFLVVHGQARFRFRHVVTGESFEVTTCGEEPVVVETIPGWTHDITNVGRMGLVSLLWASEVFDRSQPDTVPLPL